MFGATTNRSTNLNLEQDVDDLLRFDAPTAGTPRWLRKQRSCTASQTGDRFIPHRGSMDMGLAHFHLTKENSHPNADTSPSKEGYKATLANELLDGKTSSKILSFKSKAPSAPEGYQNNLRVLYTNNNAGGPRKASRHIAQTAERILDAPELVDDYYLNLLDWNSSNLLSIALGQSVYIWNATTSEINHLFESENAEAHPTAVSWVNEGNFLAVGTNNAEVQIWDVEKQRQIRSMKGHLARVGALSWNNHVLSSGSRDTMIFNHDVRLADHHIGTLQGHSEEVCGLKWSPDGTQLASGGNDNLLNIWDSESVSTGRPQFQLTHHNAAVKALAWCPWQRHLLASGGGTADRCIRFWNTMTGACVNTIDTKSQVCSIQWSKHSKELVSSHGFSQNQLCVWKYPTMTKQAELTGHTSRVLHLALSPDGTTICSAAGDETLRFWKVFEGEARTVGSGGVGVKKELPQTSFRRANLR
eukprot:GCRY01000371.1.p1 GENE.GCRY01000371.1~~GCRY01000371.1.p1  ORF type:complete len:472 (+),score=85.81 GCRY01000371.1:116-1531(+)